jgi:cellulose synthase/poly-beta-1,6-N-acetylglucosamine synthase-like glycosyltransferase
MLRGRSGMAKQSKVLLVDDEIDFLEIFKERLEASDLEVVTASEGLEALQKFRSEKPDAVLLDILMPGADGLEILRTIRESDKKIPIFIITAFSNEERFKLANQYNASGFIIKTSDLKSNVANIKKAIDIASKYKEQEWIRDCLLSILSLNYPAFEVIVVNDGSTDRTLEILNEILDLSPVDMPYVRHYKDGQVRNILRSAKHPNVTVIDKNQSYKKADALNAGLNIAQNEFVCVIDSDTVLEPDALLMVMARVERDFDRTLGIGSYFGLLNGLGIENGRITKKSFSYNPIIAYQNIEYVRSFIGNRMA